MRCCVHLFPDQKVSRNFKTKERAVVEFITERFPEYDWTNDRRVDGGCSLRRPDLFLDMLTFVLIIENDEYGDRHKTACDNRRLMELSQDVGHRPIVMLHFNPDSYKTSDGKTVRTCWFSHKTHGMLYVPSKRVADWEHRLSELEQRVRYYTTADCPPTRTITEEFLFFNDPVDGDSSD